MIKKLFFLTLILSANLAFATVDTNKRFTSNNADLELSVKLLQQTLNQKTDNFVVSPLSIYMATDLLANGAQGRSLEELQANILNSSTSTSLQNINEHLNNYLKNMSKAININNSIWGDDFLSEYVEIANKDLQSDAFPRPENTATINQWVKEKTNGLIAKALNEEATKKGAIYLVNTVYFKDDWINKFDANDTFEKDFYSLNADKPDKVSMMYSEREVDYFENDTMQAIRLPYVNGDVMQIFLPKKDVNFIDFVKNLKAEDLDINYEKQEVELHLPRFEINYKIDNMKDMFNAFGVTEVFDENLADLSALSPFPHYVEKIIHQANIRLDEEGTVASAVTTKYIHEFDGKLWYETPIFKADHPFIFMINNGLFIGGYAHGMVLKQGLNIKICDLGPDSRDFLTEYNCLIKEAEENNLTNLRECLVKNKEKYILLKDNPKKYCQYDKDEIIGWIGVPFDEKGLRECLFILDNPSIDKKSLVYDSNGYIVGTINRETKKIIFGFRDHDGYVETIGEIKNNQIVFDQWKARKYTGKIDENGKVIIDKCQEAWQ